MSKTLIFLSLLTALVLSACGAGAPAAETNAMDDAAMPGQYRDLSAETLQSMMQNKDFVLINVHVPFAGNIPETDLSLPYDQIAAYQSQLPSDKDAKIVVYCRSGSMSAIAARTLVELGYTNVWNLSGGMNAWQRAGMPLEMTP